jgi:hypothetical protein
MCGRLRRPCSRRLRRPPSKAAWRSDRAPARALWRCGESPEEVTPTAVGPCPAHAGGFDLHAGLLVRAGHRDRLERLCRYALRPPLAQERLHVSDQGEI